MKNPALNKHAGLLALVGLSDVILGLVLYWALMDNAWVRSTALPSIVLIAGGLLIGSFAIYQRRSFITISSTAVSALFGGAFLFLIFGMTALPDAPNAPQVGTAAPAFANPNQLGETVALADLHKTGPALLVFYRGH